MCRVADAPADRWKKVRAISRGMNSHVWEEIVRTSARAVPLAIAPQDPPTPNTMCKVARYDLERHEYILSMSIITLNLRIWLNTAESMRSHFAEREHAAPFLIPSRIARH